MDYTVIRTDPGPRSGKVWELRDYGEDFDDNDHERRYEIFKGDQKRAGAKSLDLANDKYEARFTNDEGVAPSSPPAA